MSSPIAIPFASRSSADGTSLYIPVHKRTAGSYGSWSSRTSSRSRSSSRSSSASLTHQTLPSPSPILTIPIYTPAALLHLSTSPLAKLAAPDVEALRATVPEVVQSRRQRKSLAWHARKSSRSTDAQHTHKRTSSRSSRSHTSESEEDRATTWRRM